MVTYKWIGIKEKVLWFEENLANIFPGRNISKNTTLIIPAHNIPAFKPAKTFVNKVKNHVRVK